MTQTQSAERVIEELRAKLLAHEFTATVHTFAEPNGETVGEDGQRWVKKRKAFGETWVIHIETPRGEST